MARIRLLPRDEKFFDLFEQATAAAVSGAETLRAMLNDIPNAESYRVKIADIEHQGDSIIHAVMEKLNRTFVTPIDPEDIRAIASRLDDIIDFTQGAAERIVLYRVSEPIPTAVELSDVLVSVTREAQRVVALLRNMDQHRDIMRHCIEVNRLENVGDHIYRQGLGRLFQAGDLTELIRWKEIFEQVEQAIDTCEDLADVIESLVVKHV